MKHRQTHPTPVDDCWACKVLSVNIAAAATPTRRPEPLRVDRRDKQLDADLTAYKRLRNGGLQPTRIDGSADLERQEPSCQFEIDTGALIPKEHMSRVQEGLAISKEMGLITDGGK